MIVPALDFNTVDDLAFAAERGRLSGQSIPEMVARDIGPVIELLLLSEFGKMPSPFSTDWLSLAGLMSLGVALERGRGRWVCPRSRLCGVLQTWGLDVEDSTIWMSFGLAAQKAARAVGFPRRIAASLAAAIDELHSNIYEHSQIPHSGLVVFRARQGGFEFVVADRGIGVLESLRDAPGYRFLGDHGEALGLALSDGVSRFGANGERGHGFRSLFVGLANLNGRLRFRSGDHALSIDGRSPALMGARVAQKASIPGLFISVNCEIDSNLLARDDGEQGQLGSMERLANA